MSSLFRRANGLYYFTYVHNGKRKWKSTGKKTEAEALESLASFDKSGGTPRPKARMTLQLFSCEFLNYAEVTFSKKTVEIYRRVLDRFQMLIGDKLLKSVTSRDSDLFKIKRMGEVSPVSVNIDLRSLRAAFSTAVRWKLISENPFKGVGMVRVPDQLPTYFTKEEFQAFLAVLPYRWFKDLVLVAVLTGARRGELLNLRWKDIDFGRRTITIQSTDTFRTKAGKRRTIPMNDALHSLLTDRAQRTTNEYLFTLKDRPIHGGLVVHIFKRCVRKAKINDKLHFHSLRHTFATWLVQADVSIYEIQKLLGHSTIAITQVYSHLGPNQLYSAVQKITLPVDFEPLALRIGPN